VAAATTAYVVSALALAERGADPLGLLARAVEAAHDQLRAGAGIDPSWAGMSTTLTAILTDEDRCALVHLGDSRAYLLREGAICQLTHDHTFVQSLVDAGDITPDQARRHPFRSTVTKALDGLHEPDPDLVLLDLRPGDRLLVCSDGLPDYATSEQIVAALRLHDKDVAVDSLVEAALAGGGRDNVTCLVADVEDGARICRDGTLVGAMGDPALVVDPTAVRLARPA
jgi:protein phosphatase